MKLADGPKEIPDDAISIIERFVILLFDRTSTCTNVNMQDGRSFHEKLAAANPTYPSCSRGACQESSLPGWSHLGEDTATRPCVAITN